MEEKIIREKNRTSMKKIANDDDRLKKQKKLEAVDCGLSSVERAAAGWSRGVVETMEFVLDCWPAWRRSEEERKD